MSEDPKTPPTSPAPEPDTPSPTPRVTLASAATAPRVTPKLDIHRHARFDGGDAPNMGTGEALLSLAAGAGLVVRAVRSGRFGAAIPLAAAGATMLYRGSTRRCPVYSATGINRSSHHAGPDAVDVVTIDRPREELYSFWRDLNNCPKFMSFVDHIEVLDETRSRWYAEQFGQPFSYEAEIISDTPNEGLRWAAVEGAPIQMRGSVRFVDAPADRGTAVIASIVFGGPTGGSIRGRLAAPLAAYTIHKDLRRFKQLMETGEIATTDGQSSGRADMANPAHYYDTTLRRPPHSEPQTTLTDDDLPTEKGVTA